MTFYVGRRGSLGVARETVRGTAVVPSTYWIPYNSLSFDDKTVTVDQESAFGRIEDSDASYITKKFAEGEFEYDLEDKIIGVILSAVTGATDSGTTTHTYSLQNTNQHQSLTLLVQDPNTAKLFRLAMVDKFSIKVEPEGLVKCTVGFRSAEGKDWTLQTPAYTALGNKFIHSMLSFKIAAAGAAYVANLAAATEANGGILKLKSLEFNISKNVEDWQDLGSSTPSDILNKQFQVDGSFEIGFTDNTYRNYMLDGTNKAMEIMFTYGASNSLQIQMPRVRFANWEPNKGLDDIVTEKIEFKGLYDAANAVASIGTIVLKNSVATAY